MATGFNKADPLFGSIDLDDEYVSDSWLVDQFVGSSLWSCGSNSNGQLGNNTGNIHYSSPIQVGSRSNWKQVAGGGWMWAAATKTDGTLWTWGFNFYGGLGNNSVVYYSSPIQVGNLTNWKQVSGGVYYNASAIKTDGTLWTWSYNNYGQLGNNSVVNSSSPIQVGNLTNWKQVSSGDVNTYAVKTDGTLWAWGGGGTGALGNGILVHSSSPIQVGNLKNWKQVSSGSNYFAAIKTDGTLWICGYAAFGFGQLGNNTSKIHYSSPIQIGNLTNWKQVDVGYEYVTAVKTDGTLWTWGSNRYGTAGNNTSNIYYSSPIQVGTLTNWKRVSSNIFHITAIKSDGTLWGWGGNGWGQLGIPMGNFSSPIQIGTLTNWKQATGNWSSTYAIPFTDIT